MRKFSTGNVSDVRTKIIESVFVSDATTKQQWESSDYPIAAIFPISQRYDLDTQEKRAKDYANYLNKLEEAAQAAYEQIHLVDVLKR